MSRLSVVAVLLAAGAATAQDMPLSEILKPGETWQPTSDDMPRIGLPPQYQVRTELHRVVRRSGSGLFEEIETPLNRPTSCAQVSGGSTLLVVDEADRYVWAFQIKKDGSLGPGDRYCRLRVRGDQRRAKTTPCTSWMAMPRWFRASRRSRTSWKRSTVVENP